MHKAWPSHLQREQDPWVKQDILCRRHKWQCFADEKKAPRKDSERDEDAHSASSSGGSEADADDDGDDASGNDGDENDEYKPPSARKEIKYRKRRWRKEEDSAVLWNIIK